MLVARLEVPGKSSLQPVNTGFVCAREDELVDDSIDANGATDQVVASVGWVLENKVVTVELCQSLPADAASHLIVLATILRE